MLVDLNPDTDDIITTIGGVTHGFTADRLTVRREDTGTRDGVPYRYLTITVQLDGEYPETTDHITKGPNE